MKMGTRTIGFVVATMFTASFAHAQVPANIAEGLKKIGQRVDRACSAKLDGAVMTKKDFTTYWPADASAPASPAQLYPGITIARQTSFGPDAKDVLDILSAEKGGGN